MAGAEAWRSRRVIKRTQLLQGSHQKEKVANFVQNSLTSIFEFTSDVRAVAIEKQGVTGILNIFVRENAVLTAPNILCHLYLFHLVKDADSSSCFSIIYPRWAVGTTTGDSFDF